MPAELVDPRNQAQPPGRPPVPVATSYAGDPDELCGLCRAGRLYEVEAWIKAGHPLQAPGDARPRGRRVPTALQIALETGQYSLALLLLSNGYNLDLEGNSPFNIALKVRRWDLVDLLWTWGADPKRVGLSILFETYNSHLFERFYAAGADFAQSHELADALGNHTSNLPLFGFAKRHRSTDPRIQMELNIALAEHVEDENLKGVHLCLWAGADPHVPARDLPSRYRRRGAPDEDTDVEEQEGWTAIDAAVSGGHVNLLAVLKPDPARDNFADLYRWAHDSRTIEVLATIAPPGNVGDIVQHQLLFLDSRSPTFTRTRAAMSALETVFKAGGRWYETTPEELKAVRFGLRKASDAEFVEVLQLLAKDDYCTGTILQELCRVPTMRQRMTKVGLLPGRQTTGPVGSRGAPRRDHNCWSSSASRHPRKSPSAPRTNQPFHRTSRSGDRTGMAPRCGWTDKASTTASGHSQLMPSPSPGEYPVEGWGRSASDSTCPSPPAGTGPGCAAACTRNDSSSRRCRTGSRSSCTRRLRLDLVRGDADNRGPHWHQHDFNVVERFPFARGNGMS